ncbi:MAG: hypothetical protein M3T96_04015 [Acidobacteriota bacterium]|nr:hypothetical protein [Acidobacteriota bacterium]
METADVLRILFSSALYKLPILIVAVGGIIFAATNYSKNPSVNRRVIGGLIMLLAADVFSLLIPFLNLYIYRNYGVQSYFIYFGYLVGTLIAVVSAVGVGLILLAVWTQRKPV